MNIFGERLRELRKAKGLTDNELAEILGVKRRAVVYYQSGEREPKIEQLIQLAQFFDCSIDYIVGLTDNPKRC